MSKIDDAKQYVLSKVIEPALRSNLSDEYKNKAINARTWINKFEHVGDLLDYLKRFKSENNDKVYLEFKKYNLQTFEDILEDFVLNFEIFSNDKTTPSSFIIGEEYSSYKILTLAKKYDTRVGGILILGNCEAAVIKATLSGGNYPNEWLEEHYSLKYYLKSINNKYSTEYKENKAIISTNRMPIYTFIRNMPEDPFTYEGIFYFSNLTQEVDGSMWFKLDKDSSETTSFYDEEYYRSLEARKLEESFNSSNEEREKRLKQAPKKPKQVTVVTKSFLRNMDVVTQVLLRANGVCESCCKPAPFTRRSDGTPYLEVHHKIKLADDGEDTVDNAIALCPNCHRREHFGIN